MLDIRSYDKIMGVAMPWCRHKLETKWCHFSLSKLIRPSHTGCGRVKHAPPKLGRFTASQISCTAGLWLLPMSPCHTHGVICDCSTMTRYVTIVVSQKSAHWQNTLQVTHPKRGVGTSGIAKAGPGQARARPKLPFILLMSHDLARSPHEQLACIQQVPGQYQWPGYATGGHSFKCFQIEPWKSTNVMFTVTQYPLGLTNNNVQRNHQCLRSWVLTAYNTLNNMSLWAWCS